MKKILSIILAAFTVNIHCTLIDDLNSARQQLIEAKKGVVDGRKGLKDAYATLKENSDKIKNPIVDLNTTIGQITWGKIAIGSFLALGPILAITINIIPIVGQAISAVLTVAVSSLFDMPGILDNVQTTLRSIKDTLTNVSNTFTPTIELINPDLASTLVYPKFNDAEKKFDSAIKKIDGLIEALTE